MYAMMLAVRSLRLEGGAERKEDYRTQLAVNFTLEIPFISRWGGDIERFASQVEVKTLSIPSAS